MSAIPAISRRKKASEIRELLKGPVKEEPKAEEEAEAEAEEQELLLLELAKVKAEKAERKFDEKTDIFSAAGKSWREDAVFQSGETRRSEISSRKPGNLFNDMIKSDFHRKFLDKYVAK